MARCYNSMKKFYKNEIAINFSFEFNTNQYKIFKPE